MKRTKRKNIIGFIGILTLVFIDLFSVTTVMAENKNNGISKTTRLGTKHKGAWTTETASVYYNGGVFFYPYYATRTHQGFAKYSRGRRTLDYNYTGYVSKTGKRHSVSKKREAKVSAWDSLKWSAPKTTFNYSFK